MTQAHEIFKSTVETIFVAAKHALPTLNGRVEKARDIVLAQGVLDNQDGTFSVKSQTEDKTYLVKNNTCTCADYTHRNDFCKHVVATMIQRRARKAVAEQLVESTPVTTPAPLPEAAVSMNVTVEVEGRSVLVTLRGTDETIVMQRIQKLLKQCPTTTPATKDVGYCALHGVRMRLNKWNKFSHKHLEGWCSGKQR